MVTWGELRNTIRVGILDDTVAGEYRWSDAELMEYVNWALDMFCHHTAVATATSFTNTSSLHYDLPDNLYTPDPLDVSGLVYLQKSNGALQFLVPVRATPNTEYTESGGFYTLPETKLHLTSMPEANSIMHVEYFAYYDRITSDTDPLTTPRWAESAICYAVGAYAIGSNALKAASIRQFNSRDDSGNPVQNPLLEQQKWFLKMYDMELARYTPQNRTAAYRQNHYS